ncbi:MAG: hypothetical protein HZC37_17990 [Burkholderiales bacterium]|nr:hypothetical protein [Burkholderiales bacterium]
MSKTITTRRCGGLSLRPGAPALAAALAIVLAGCVAAPGGGGASGGYDVSVIDSTLPSIGNESKSATLLATNKSVAGRQVHMKFLAGGEADKMFVVQAGGPADDGRAAPLGDLWQRGSVSGSVLGFRVNQATKVTVASSDFKPRVLILERSGDTPGPQVKPVYVVVGSGEAVEGVGGGHVASISWRQPEKNTRNTTGGPIIAVLSESGKPGAYSLKVENSN